MPLLAASPNFSRRRVPSKRWVVAIVIVLWSLLCTSCVVDSGSFEAAISEVEVAGAATEPTTDPLLVESDPTDGVYDDGGSEDGASSEAASDSSALGFRFLPEAEAARAQTQVGFQLDEDGSEVDTDATAGTAENPEPNATDSSETDADDPANPDDPATPSDAATSSDAATPSDTEAQSSASAPGSGGSLDALAWGPGSGAVWVATAKPETGYVQIFDGPDGTPITPKYEYLDGTIVDYPLWNPTYFGGPLSLMVVSGQPDDAFVEVLLPIRPSGSTGWIRTPEFTFFSNDFFVEIDVSTNHVSVWEGSELILESAAVTGRPDRPTPVLRTYIDEKLPGPNSAYGPWMLTLGSFSEALNTFGAGLPKLAMHGTNEPGLMGQYASSGCIRLPNEVITQIAEAVPVGTRVGIVRS